MVFSCCYAVALHVHFDYGTSQNMTHTKKVFACGNASSVPVELWSLEKHPLLGSGVLLGTVLMFLTQLGLVLVRDGGGLFHTGVIYG